MLNLCANKVLVKETYKLVVTLLEFHPNGVTLPHHLFLHQLYVTGSRIPLLKTPVPASYIAVEEAVGVIRERCYRDDQTPVLKSEQFR